MTRVRVARDRWEVQPATAVIPTIAGLASKTGLPVDFFIVYLSNGTMAMFPSHFLWRVAADTSGGSARTAELAGPTVLRSRLEK